MSRRFGLLPALLIVFGACHSGGDDEATEQAVVAVRTVRAATRDFPQTIDAIGTVQPRPGRFASLGAPAATRVARVFVAPGQAVRAGDPLVEFERAPFEAAARSAAAALTAAQASRDRAVRLADAGVLPRKDVDQAEADLAQAQLQAVSAQRSLELATLRAPLAGVVTSMTAVVGQSVDPSQPPLVEVVDPHALDVVLAVTPTEAARIRPGAPVSVNAGQDAEGEPLGDGRVTDVSEAIDTVSRAVPVRVAIGRPARPLRIRETVFGRITTGVHPHAVSVPLESLVPEGDRFKVFVVDSTGLARARYVTTGARIDSTVEITGGLAAGATVVSYGAYGLEDSTRVVTGPAPAAP